MKVAIIAAVLIFISGCSEVTRETVIKEHGKHISITVDLHRKGGKIIGVGAYTSSTNRNYQISALQRIK